MMLALSILIVLFSAFLSCVIFFKKTEKAFQLRLFICLFIPFSIGTSSIFFIFLNLLGFSLWLICLTEITLLIGLLIRYKINPLQELKKARVGFIFFNFNKLFKEPLLLLAMVIYFYAVLMNAGVFLFDTIKEPHGLWDAWNYWNLKAKFISRAPGEWPALFHQMGSEEFHVDYPLLQTGFIARCWLSMKNESIWIPAIFAFIFTFCTIGLVSSSINFFSTKIRGLIAGLILLATPFYMVMGDSQYADNTVGFFFLATVVLLTFARSEQTIKPQLLFASGVAAGLSAWSKNEGLLFICCLFASQLLLLFYKNYKIVLHEMKYILYGMLPILLFIIYYKTAIAPPNDIVKAQGESTLLKLTDYSRYATISNWFISTFGTFGKWIINPWWLFLGGALYKGISLKKHGQSLMSNFFLLFLMITGYFLIYVITPLDLTFHLSTSIHRLFFQLFPTFIFLYFLILKDKSTGN